MWKKTEDQIPAARPAAPATSVGRTEVRREVATIGPSIRIQGDLSGEEDLVIQGAVEGEVSLKQNNVTVGKSGRVKADIFGKSIRVEGEIHGNLYGTEEVVIRASGRVRGNIVSPRVTLENGSKFKGSIDMEPAAQRKAEPAAPAKPAVAAKPPSGDRPAKDAPADRSTRELKPTASGG